MNHSGGETWNEYSRAVTSTMPETVFVGPLSRTSTDVYIAWPPQKTPQVPVPPMMSQLAESDRIVREVDTARFSQTPVLFRLTREEVQIVYSAFEIVTPEEQDIANRMKSFLAEG